MFLENAGFFVQKLVVHSQFLIALAVPKILKETVYYIPYTEKTTSLKCLGSAFSKSFGKSKGDTTQKIVNR